MNSLTQQAGRLVAQASRAAPFERGRWRLGSLAYRMVGTPANGNEGCTIATRHGFRMRLDLREFVDRTIFCTGEWEPLETALFKHILRPGDAFVDVGANIGYFSLLAAQLVGPAGAICAIEANPRTFALLAANVRLNGLVNVDARRVAAGDTPGHASIVTREVGNAGADAVDFLDAAGEQTVAVERLDEMLQGQPVRLIKIDVEGAEAKVLYGAEGVLQGPAAPDVIFEFTPQFLTGQGDSGADLLRYLEKLGYAIFEIGKAGLSPADAGALAAQQTYLFCTKGAPPQM